MQIWPARVREKSFASGLWETADPVMCFGGGGLGVKKKERTEIF